MGKDQVNTMKKMVTIEIIERKQLLMKNSFMKEKVLVIKYLKNIVLIEFKKNKEKINLAYI
jgi:hypothetical protein